MGFAYTSLQFAQFSEADEMWTVNFAWRYGVPRIDRLFEIHPIEVLAYIAGQGKPDNYDAQHLSWLQEEHDFTIYTHADYTGENILDTVGDVLEDALSEGRITKEAHEKYSKKYANIINDPPRIPNSVPYQWDIINPIFENLIRENKPDQIYMPSTISYMLALAIHEGFERIEMYGIEMAANSGGANGTEYVYQKAGAEGLMMYAMGKGIEIYLTENCKLMNIKPYHKGLQMITRQTLEGLKVSYEQKRVDALTKANYYKGQIGSAEKEALEKKAIFERGIALKTIEYEDIIKQLEKDISLEDVVAKKNKLQKKLKRLKKNPTKELADLQARYQEFGEESSGLIMDLVKNINHWQGLAYMADANVQLCSQLIDSIDLDNPLVELINRFTFKDVEPEEKLEKEKVLA